MRWRTLRRPPYTTCLRSSSAGTPSRSSSGTIRCFPSLNIDKGVLEHIENDIKAVETEMDDDAESIITNERYIYIGEVIKACYKKKNAWRAFRIR